ncbi:MAG: hypothetical protein IJS51_05070 [Treponema sp.]|nr:hypothetical protein [Treponema sp.]MBQ7619486.1 hypothetical protein [Treponema sp.]
MKKRTSFFLCLIILLAFGGYVFYTGWTQFKVPSGNVGIVVSKTSGVNLNPVTHDKFSWTWEFLLPTNAKVVSFSPKTENFQKSVSGLLPSGKEYAKVFNGGADFSFAFDFSIDAKASVENICDLLKSGDIQNQEDLDKLLNRAAENFANLAAQKILSAALSPSGADFVQAQELAQKEMDDFSSSQNSKVSIQSVTLKKYSVPDIALYKSAALAYEDYSKIMGESAAKNAQKEAEENSRFKTTMQKMERLGETLKKYPELSDMIKSSDNINKTLQTIDSIE